MALRATLAPFRARSCHPKTGETPLNLRVHSLLGQDHLPIERFVGSVATTNPVRVPGTAVYLYSHAGTTPPALLANLRLNEVLHETIVILSVTTEDVPRIHRAERAAVWDLGFGFYQTVLRYGFMEHPDVPAALGDITRPGFGVDPTDTLYILGRETVLATARPDMAPWREKLFALMTRNAMSAVRFFHLPPERSLEIGVNVEIRKRRAAVISAADDLRSAVLGHPPLRPAAVVSAGRTKSHNPRTGANQRPHPGGAISAVTPTAPSVLPSASAAPDEGLRRCRDRPRQRSGPRRPCSPR